MSARTRGAILRSLRSLLPMSWLAATVLAGCGFHLQGGGPLPHSIQFFMTHCLMWQKIACTEQ